MASVTTARIMPISQKRVTIFAYGIAFTGLEITLWIPSFWK